MWEQLTAADRMLVCLDLSDLYVTVSTIAILRALFDASDDELNAAWDGLHEEHWPEDQFRVARPGDPGFRFNDIQPSRCRRWPSTNVPQVPRFESENAPSIVFE